MCMHVQAYIWVEVLSATDDMQQTTSRCTCNECDGNCRWRRSRSVIATDQSGTRRIRMCPGLSALVSLPPISSVVCFCLACTFYTQAWLLHFSMEPLGLLSTGVSFHGRAGQTSQPCKPRERMALLRWPFRRRVTEGTQHAAIFHARVKREP